MRSVPACLRCKNRSWYGRERARSNTAMLTGQSTVQKPTDKSLTQAARGCFLASPSRTCPSVVSTADARLVFQHTLIESKRLAPARSSHGVARKTMKRRILILARRFSTQDTTILRHHRTSVTTTESFSAVPPWILTPDTSVSRARSLVFRCLRLKRIYRITWTPRAFQHLAHRFPRSLTTSNRI